MKMLHAELEACHPNGSANGSTHITTTRLPLVTLTLEVE